MRCIPVKSFGLEQWTEGKHSTEDLIWAEYLPAGGRKTIQSENACCRHFFQKPLKMPQKPASGGQAWFGQLGLNQLGLKL